MNDTFKSLFGASLAGLFALFAMNGEEFFASCKAAWLFLLHMTSSAPLGLSSFVLALALGVVTQASLHHWIPRWDNRAMRQFVIESTALAVGVGVMWLQLHSLDGLLLGLLAGFMAPWIQKAICMVAAFTWRKINAQENP